MEPWLNKKFIEQVLRDSENDDTICVTDISARSATNEGDNFTSEMIRMKVHFSRYEKGNEATEQRSLIVKSEFEDESERKLYAQGRIFEVEITMMSRILKEMNAILPNTKLSCNCLLTQQHDRDFLILEDLAELGFRMVNRLDRLDYQHSMLALKSLAKFHAASVAVCEKTPAYRDIICKGVFHRDSPVKLLDFFFMGRMRGLSKAVASWPGFGESYSTKLMKLSEVIADKVANCHIRDDNEFNVINHNDCWTNNMLFKYDGNGRVTEHIMVDFQACYYGSPSIDLTHFLSLCISETVTKKQRDGFIGEYLKVLTSTMHDIGCKTHPPSMAELQNAMRKREIHGLLMSCSVLPFNIVDRKKLNSDDEVYENEIYKAEISEKLHLWNDMGLLDI